MKVKCPVCKREVERENKYFPFCSQRCSLIDLGKWLEGRYYIPERKVSDEKGEDKEE